MKKISIFISLFFLLLVLDVPAFAQATDGSNESTATIEETVPEEPETLEPFTDVPEGSLYFVPVQFLHEKRIIQGYGDGTFRPKESVNRVEALSMILRSAAALPSQELIDIQQFNLPVDTILSLSFPSETDITIKTPTMETPIELERTGVLEFILPQGGIIRSGRIFLDQSPIFTDVSPEDWFYNLLKRALSLGIIQGYPDGTFKPEQTSNLAESLALLLRTHRIPTEPLSEGASLGVEDVAASEWFAPLMVYALSRTIVIPNFQNRVQPEKEMTRGEIAALVYRFLRSQENIQFGRASWYADGLSSIRVKSHTEYQDQNFTAAHKELAFGTLVRVKNLRTGAFVDVVINDRGPYMPGRIIDLSKTAFEKLADPTSGVIPIELEVISPP